jgi:hypothetical protein
MAQFQFDTNTVAPRENNFEVLPAGTYAGQVTESEIVSLKSGNGSALKLTIEVLTEGYRGRKVWARLNVRHNNPTAEQIAQQQLRELCDSVGLVRMTDTVELHNKPFQVKLKIRKDDTGQYEDQNEVVGFKALGGSPAHAQAMVAATSMQPMPGGTFPTQPAAATGAATPPWVKKTAA